MLSDLQILEKIVDLDDNKLVFISPLIDPLRQIGPSSLDLRLGTKLTITRRFSDTHIDLTDKKLLERQKRRYFEDWNVAPDGEFVLHPGEFALASTLEYIRLPNDIAARLEGRSSMGRLGLQVHATAGFVDPGFEGTLTFELINSGNLPVRIRPGTRLGQICFFEMDRMVQVGYMDRPSSKYGGKVDVQESQAQLDPEIGSGPVVHTRPESDVIIRSGLTDEQVQEVAQAFPETLIPHVHFDGFEEEAESYALPLFEILAVSGGLASMASLGISIRRILKERRETKQWTSEKLRALIREELTDHDIWEFEIIETKDLDELKAGKQSACKVIVKDDNSKRLFQVIVFWDGDRSTLEITP